MTLREDFEKLFSESYKSSLYSDEEAFQKKSNGDYVDWAVQDAWEIYQAATAAAIERCAKVCESVAERHLTSGRYISAVADHSIRAGGQVDGAEECERENSALLNAETKEPKM